MPIRRISSPALARQAQSSSASGRQLLAHNLKVMQQDKDRLVGAFDKVFADWKRDKDTPSSDEGGGAMGAGIGAAIPLVLAPFTGGASLAFLPAATAAGGAIGTAMDKPSGPGAAAASQQKQQMIGMASPFAGGAVMGIQNIGQEGGFGAGFGKGYKFATGGDPVVWPDQEPGMIEPAAPAPSLPTSPGTAGGPMPRGAGNQWPTFQEIQAMTPAQRDALDPRINEVYEYLMGQEGSELLGTPIDRWRQQNPMPFTGGAY